MKKSQGSILIAVVSVLTVLAVGIISVVSGMHIKMQEQRARNEVIQSRLDFDTMKELMTEYTKAVVAERWQAIAQEWNVSLSALEIEEKETIEEKRKRFVKQRFLNSTAYEKESITVQSLHEQLHTKKIFFQLVSVKIIDYMEIGKTEEKAVCFVYRGYIQRQDGITTVRGSVCIYMPQLDETEDFSVSEQVEWNALLHKGPFDYTIEKR